VVLNRAALDELHLALADGVEAIARTIVETADPPDATPFGVGLVTQGGWAVYSGSKKVAGGSLGGAQPQKPRAFRTVPGAITGFAGFGFPGRFQETGTVHQPARPFFTPAVLAVKARAAEIMASVVGPRLRSKR
jgi:HK97 gp10 family phage protein